MKNLLICTRIMHLIFWISLGSLMVNCEEVESPNPITQPTPTPTPDPEEPVQELKVPAVVIRINRQVEANLRISGIKEAVITIRKEDGTRTEYEIKKIQVEEQDGYYLTEKIFLPEGSYEVVAFYILGEGNAVREATPLKTSSLAENQTVSLPIPFEIVPIASDTEDEPVTQLPINVISVAGKSPKDFGFQSFEMQVKDPVSIYVALVTDARLMDFISGTLQIAAGEKTVDQELIEGINQIVVLSKAEEYMIKAEKPYYLSFSQTFTYEDLTQFTEYPLVIELEEMECRPRDFLGDVSLTNQTAINNWAKYCYVGVSGNLTIRDNDPVDPIVDLSPLEAITHIYGNLTVDNTTKLKTLQGLHNLTTVEGWVSITDNNGLETLEGLGLPEDSNLHLTIQGNSSLLNLQGLEKVYSLGYVDISSNPRLVNFKGLDQVQEINGLRIASNDSQTSFEGLNNLRHISTLEIVGIDITNFDGFQGLQTIGSLSLYNLYRFSNFDGFSGKVTFSVDLTSTSVKSLEGLNVAEELMGLTLWDNSNLTNLRGLGNLKKVKRRLDIEENLSLNSLEGLENLILVGIEGEARYKMHIRSNNYLTNFCALTKLFGEGEFHEADIRWNGYNPTVEQITLDECKGDLY